MKIYQVVVIKDNDILENISFASAAEEDKQEAIDCFKAKLVQYNIEDKVENLEYFGENLTIKLLQFSPDYYFYNFGNKKNKTKKICGT